MYALTARCPSERERSEALSPFPSIGEDAGRQVKSGSRVLREVLWDDDFLTSRDQA